MYPTAELTALAQRKTLLRARISLNRLRCVVLAGEVVRPLNWIDRMVAQWRKISPMAKLAAVPLGLLLKRAVLPGKKINFFNRAMRLLPIVLSAVKIFNAPRRRPE